MLPRGRRLGVWPKMRYCRCKATGKQKRRCKPSCLRQRMIEQLPQARKLLASEGYTHLTRKLLEQGVVTYTVKHMRGCLSPISRVGT
jgi:hypothetical protein